MVKLHRINIIYKISKIIIYEHNSFKGITQMLQIKITNKSDLLKVLNSTSIKKIHTKTISDQNDINSFLTYVKTNLSSIGTLTFIAIKE